MKTEVKINFLLVALISFIFLFKLPTAFTQEIDPILQFNQTSSTNITGNASTIAQSEIDAALNVNSDGLIWDVTEADITPPFLGPITFTTQQVESLSSAPLASDKIVLAWCDEVSKTINFKIYSTTGETLVDTVTVDTSSGVTDACNYNSVSVSALNLTHFVIAWFDSAEQDTTFAVYDYLGNLVLGPIDEDTAVGTNSWSASVSAFNSTHIVIGYYDYADQDATFSTWNLATQTRVAGPIDVDAGVSTDSYNVHVSAFNSTHFAFFYYDAGATDDATFAVYTITGTAVRAATDEDTAIGNSYSLALTALNSTHFVVAYYDAADADITFSIYNSAGTRVVGPIDEDTDVGTSGAFVSVAALNSTHFVISYYDTVDGQHTFSIYNWGTRVVGPIDVSNVASGLKWVSVASYFAGVNLGICNQNFIFAEVNETNNARFFTYTPSGGQWNGYCSPIYQVSVEHNATISYDGTLNSINVSINFTSTTDDVYNMTIYDFINSAWDASPCENVSVTAGNYVTIWCNITANPTNYNSSEGIVRIRLNSTADLGQGTLKEEYVQYYISTYDSIPPTYSLNSTNSTIAGTAVSHNLYWTDNVELSGYVFSFYNCSSDVFSYQENANEFACSGDWLATSPCSNVYDGSWDTAGLGSLVGTLFINYTKPSDATEDSLWQVKDESETVNLSIPLSCWNYDSNKLLFKVVSDNTPSAQHMEWFCYNGSWQVLRSVTGLIANVYEEAMWWNVLKNDTWVPFGGTGNWSNVTKVINSTVGCTIKWKVYANDTSNNWNASDTYSYTTTSANQPPTLGNRIEVPSSPTTYSQGAIYRFNITINDPQGEADISTVLFEWQGVNETVTDYVVHNSTARNYSITKIDLPANPTGYIFRWYVNDSQNAWGNVIEGIYIINKATPSLSITFSANPATYPTETTTTCNKLAGDYLAILTLYRNGTQVAQGSGNSVSETVVLGAGVWNYSCVYSESENYTSISIINQNLQVNKGNNILDSLTCSPSSVVTYPTETTCTGSQTTSGDEDVVYYLYRDEVLVSQQTNANPSETILLGAGSYLYKFNSSEGANYTANATGLTLTLTVQQNTSTINYMNLTINGTESNKEYNYPVATNVTGWFNVNAFVGPAPVFTLYRNTTTIGTNNPISDVSQLAAGFYNYTYYTPGNQNYTSALKQFNLTIQKADILPYLHIAINNTEADASYTYENVTNATAWSTLTGQSGITYNLYRNTSTTSTFIGSGTFVSEIIRLGADTYYYVYNTTGNENYTSGSLTRILTITQKTPINLLDASPSWTNTYPTETTVTCSIFSLNNEVIAQLYRNSSATNPLPSTTETIALGGGAHEYVCNNTATQNYTTSSNSSVMIIQRNTSTINYMNLTLGIGTTGIENNFTTTYPTTTNATGWYSSSVFNGQAITFTLYRNSIPIGTNNPISDIILLGNGSYNYTYYTPGNENYTSATKNYWLFINKGNPSSYVNLYIDNQSSDRTIVYPATAEIRGNVSVMPGANDLIFNLYRNGILIDSGNTTNQTVDSTRLGNGTYIFVYNTSGGANWTSGSSPTRTLYVLKGIVCLHLTINGTEASQTLIYENITNVTGWSEVTEEDLIFNLYRDDLLKASGSPASEITRLGAGTYTYIYNTSGGANYTSNSTSLTLTIDPKTINIYLALNGTEGNRTYTYPEAINATAWKDPTINEEGSLSLLRDGIIKGSNQIVSEIIILGNGTYNYSALFSASNYTAESILTNRFALVNKGIPPIFLAINGTQGNVTYTYPSASNATGWLETFNNEGEVQLWRNGESMGKGKVVKEEILLGAGEYNYSLTFDETQNYSSASITQDRFLKINRALSTATLILEPTSPITYGTPTIATCIETNPEDNGKLWRNGTDMGSENNTAIILPAGVWYYVCNVSETQNYTFAEDSAIYIVDKAVTKVRLFLNGTENDAIYTYEDYANITATLNVSDKIFYIEANFTGISEVIAQGEGPLTLITNNFGAGLFNITAYWNGDQNYTSDTQTYFMTVNKKSTVVYLWINGSRENKYFLNKSYANFTVELVGYPGKIVELWTNYTDGQWKKWDYGSSPLENITQLTKTGTFNFTGNYSGNANYSASHESWILSVGVLNLESKLESLYPKNINQGENSTAIGNCSCSGGACNGVYIEIQADDVLIPNVTSSYLQVNGSNPYYIGTLENNWALVAWNITGWEAGNYTIRVKCNSTETGESFSTEEFLQVNDTTPPKWFNNFTFPTSPAIYSPGQSYWFNITWLDNLDVSTVLIEHNFTEGFLRNDTMNKDGYDYYFYVKDLPVGTYVFRIYANDTNNNWNTTDFWIYVISKAPTLIKLFLNGSESDRTYNVSDIANFTVSLNISGKTVHLETNMSAWLLQSGTTPLFNYTKLEQKGIFNITGYFLGDENYTASSKTYFATVLDIESPKYFNLGQDSSWVGVNKSILLSANWNDNYDLDYAWLSTNETGGWGNKSAIKLNLAEGQTWSNFSWRNSSIPAGWTIAWRICANDSSGNENVTEIMSFEVNASEMWKYLTGDMIFSSPAIGDVNYDASIDVVLASYDKNVYVVSGKNGSKIWNFSTDGKISSSPSLASTNNDNFLNIFIGSYDFNIYALNGSDGSKIWNFSTDGKIFSSPAISDVNKDGFLDVVFGSEDGKIYALNGSDGNLLWSFSTNGKIVSSPALINLSVDGYPIVFIGSYDFNIYALNGSDGSKIWNFSAGEKIESSPAVDDLDMNNDLEVIFGSYDKNVYVLDASTGEKVWNYTTGNWITSSPVITRTNNSKKIIISSHDGNVYCFNHDGSINWTFSVPTGGRVPYLPSVADFNLDGIDDTAIGATDGRIYVLNGIDGSLLWSYVIGKYIYSSPAIADLNEDGSSDLTFGSTNQYQYALDPPSWNCFGGNERRTRIFDNSPPQLLSFSLEENDGKKILSSLWREKFSNLDYAIVQENSTSSEKIEKIKLKGMIDWVNYSFSDTSYYKITVFDEYGNSEIIEGFVEIERKDLQPPLWLIENDHIKVNYSKNFELKLNVSWFDESKIEDVIIEHNFTGEFKNESLNEISDNVYSYSVKNLPAGIYVWKEYAKDIYKNWNSTPFFILEISKSYPLLDFHLPEKIVYPNPIVFKCIILEGDENAKLILKRNDKEILKGNNVYSEEFLKAGLWNYSCIYPETQNYSYFETTKSVEVEKGFPVLNLIVDYEKNVCPARVNLSAYETNTGDEDVSYTLYGKELISFGSEINYVDNLKVGNYLFIYNSTGGENWTSSQISRMVIVNDLLPPQNLVFSKRFERGKGLNIYSLWQENCSSLAYGIVEENSTGKFKEHKIEMVGNLDWANYTIPLEDLNSESGCKWFLFVCFKNIHFNMKVFDEYKNQQKLNDSFIYIFIKPKGLTNFLLVG